MIILHARIAEHIVPAAAPVSLALQIQTLQSAEENVNGLARCLALDSRTAGPFRVDLVYTLAQALKAQGFTPEDFARAYAEINLQEPHYPCLKGW